MGTEALGNHLRRHRAQRQGLMVTRRCGLLCLHPKANVPAELTMEEAQTSKLSVLGT